MPKHGLVLEKDADIPMRDGVGSAPYAHYSADYNTGANTIYTGREDSVLPAVADHPALTEEAMMKHNVWHNTCIAGALLLTQARALHKTPVLTRRARSA